MVKPAGGRKRRCDVGHTKRDDQAEANADRPNNARCRAADRADAELEGCDSPGENANDRKRYGKIGKAAHPAQKLLSVTHALKELHIVRALWADVTVCR